MLHGNSYTIAVTYVKDAAYVATGVRVVLPFNFVWPGDSLSVSYTNMTANQTISGDTITFNNIVFSSDSTTISIQNVIAPDSTALYPIYVQSKVTTNFSSINSIPKIVNFGLPMTIAEVKGNDIYGVALKSGQLVTVRGVITVANQFGGPSYIQDNTGGLAIFGSALSTTVNIGDEVIVSGVVSPYSGLLELTLPYVHTITSTGNVVNPILLTCSQVYNDGVGGVELYEGLLVRINGVVVKDTGGTAIISLWTSGTSGTNYRLFDASGKLDVRVDNNVDFANTAAPQSAFDVIGVIGQYKSGTPDRKSVV
jgi:hypothetical protein